MLICTLQIVNKILKIRLWHSWNKNIGEAHRPQPLLDPLSTSAVAITAPLEILCISQFTLYGKLKGNKVDFHNAMKSAPAKELYDDVLAGLRKELGEARVHDGIFGAMMQVEIINDGRKPSSASQESRRRADNRGSCDDRDRLPCKRQMITPRTTPYRKAAALTSRSWKACYPSRRPARRPCPRRRCLRGGTKLLSEAFRSESH